MSGTRNQIPGSGTATTGAHHPNMGVACLLAFLGASLGAGVTGMFADFVVVTDDPGYGTPGFALDTGKRLAATGAAVLAIGAVVLWVLWRCFAGWWVWDRGGLAYQAPAKRRGAIAWRDVDRIHAAGARFVNLTAHGPDGTGDLPLTTCTAGGRSGRRWSMWSRSQEELIDALDVARTAAAQSRFPPPPPAAPRVPRVLPVLVAAWLLVAAGITVAVLAVDHASNFAFQLNVRDSPGG